jgi:hypothetical protein
MFISGGCGVAMIWMVFGAGSNAYDGFSSMIGIANLLNSLALHGGILRGFRAGAIWALLALAAQCGSAGMCVCAVSATLLSPIVYE